MISCSIGIMAYNEEANIGRLLEALSTQELSKCKIKDIWVVSSGCKDDTEKIVTDYCKKDSRINLIVQREREGKASAINLFLPNAQGDIVILESGDTLPEKDTIENLLLSFSDPKVGMAGGHPVPVNSPDTFLGYTVHLLWKLHHKIALKSPKLGELIAFRNIVKEIPGDTAVDEASIEAIIVENGYKLKYAAYAIVYNKGPENINDFLKQRRRISAGHLYLKNTQSYSVSTGSGINILGPFFQEINWNGKELIWSFGAVLLEIIGRLLGYYDLYIKKTNPTVWDIAASTKRLERL